MDEPMTPEEERLVARLRREAEAEGPAFSEALHRRIVAATVSRGVRPRPGGGRPPLPRAWLAAAVAAGLLVAATLLVARWVVRAGPGISQPRETVVVPPREEVPGVPEVPPPPELDPLEAVAGSPAATVGTLVDAKLVDSQWAYLDHDARLAAGLMLDQIPLDLGLLAEDEIER